MVILGVLPFINISSYGTIVVEPTNEGSPSTYCFVGATVINAMCAQAQKGQQESGIALYNIT